MAADQTIISREDVEFAAEAVRHMRAGPNAVSADVLGDDMSAWADLIERLVAACPKEPDDAG